MNAPLPLDYPTRRALHPALRATLLEAVTELEPDPLLAYAPIHGEIAYRDAVSACARLFASFLAGAYLNFESYPHELLGVIQRCEQRAGTAADIETLRGAIRKHVTPLEPHETELQ